MEDKGKLQVHDDDWSRTEGRQWLKGKIGEQNDDEINCHF
jgi:hypothetical protein